MGMTDGITILNQTLIWEPRSEVLSFIMMILLIFGLIFWANTFDNIILRITIALGLCLIFCLVLYFGLNVKTGGYEYQAIISDDYPTQSLYEKYEVIRQEGKIWVLRDKEKK